MARKVWNFEIYTFVYTKVQKKSEITKKKIWIHSIQILIWTLTGLKMVQNGLKLYKMVQNCNFARQTRKLPVKMTGMTGPS